MYFYVLPKRAKRRKMKMLKLFGKFYKKFAGSATLNHTCYALINLFTLHRRTRAISFHRFCLFSLAFIPPDSTRTWNITIWLLNIQHSIKKILLSSNFHINTTSRRFFCVPNIPIYLLHLFGYSLPDASAAVELTSNS